MSLPSFQEAHISQIPALRLLQQLGYAYLSPEEVAVERRGKIRHVLVKDDHDHPNRGLLLRIQNAKGDDLG